MKTTSQSMSPVQAIFEKEMVCKRKKVRRKEGKKERKRKKERILRKIGFFLEHI